jgi:hypothetical protein
MASAHDKDTVREIINAYYKFAGLSGWRGEVNEKVAEVFGFMSGETQRCSRAFVWVPRPPGGRATTTWIVVQLGRSAVGRIKDERSFTCARGVIYRWGRELNRAAITG